MLEYNTDASILVYKHCPKRTGFNMHAENTRSRAINFLYHILFVYTHIYIYIKYD